MTNAGRTSGALESSAASDASAEGIRRSVLADGARVVTEAMPSLRSVAVGFWVGCGGVDEDNEILGASHFLEHLLFKGTQARTAAEIAHDIEAVGGDMNAFTTQEYTAFYVRVPDAHLGLALEILSDVVWAPAFRADEVESERQVILEEIRMRDDAPDDVVHELFAEAMYPNHPLGRPVIGTPETITAMSRDAIAQYHAGHYHPSTVVVAAAGHIDHEEVVDLVQARMPSGLAPAPAHPESSMAAPARVRVHRRPTEQAHLVLGMRGPARDDPDRYTLAVVNQAFGGGMSSRLFQEVREKRGLAYSVYSYRSAFRGTGALGVYAGTAPERAHETIAVLRGEIERLATHGLTDDEIDAAKGHLHGSTALSLESSSSRMHRIGGAELTLGEVPSLDEIVARVDAVTADDVRRVIARVVDPEVTTLAVVGPFDDDEFAGSAR